MSIETLLTLGLATAILVVAAILRFVVLGVARLGLRLSGRDVPWLQKPHREQAPEEAPRRSHNPIRPRLGRAGHKLAGEAAFLASAFAEGLTIAAVGTAREARSLVGTLTGAARSGGGTTGAAVTASAAAVAPKASDALATARHSTASALRRIKPAFVIAVATVQHLGALAISRVRGWVEQQQEERSLRPGEPTASGDGPRVIDLDREFDPLTDDFPEDRVGSSV